MNRPALIAALREARPDLANLSDEMLLWDAGRHYETTGELDQLPALRAEMERQRGEFEAQGRGFLGDMGSALKRGTASFRQAFNVAQGADDPVNAQDIASAELVKQRNQPSDEFRQFMQAEGFWDSAKAFAANPLVITTEVMMESLPNMVPGMGAGMGAGAIGTAIGGALGNVPGAAVGGMIGSALGAGAGSTAVETASKMLEVMTENGMDPADPQSVAEFFSNPQRVAEAKSLGLRRGLPVGAFDALSAGFAGRFVAPLKAAAKAGKPVSTSQILGRTAADVAVTQALPGAAGEVAGQLAAGEDLDLKSAFLEGVAEIASAPSEMRTNLGELRVNPSRRAANPVFVPETPAAKPAAPASVEQVPVGEVAPFFNAPVPPDPAEAEAAARAPEAETAPAAAIEALAKKILAQGLKSRFTPDELAILGNGQNLALIRERVEQLRAAATTEQTLRTARRPGDQMSFVEPSMQQAAQTSGDPVIGPMAEAGEELSLPQNQAPGQINIETFLAQQARQERERQARALREQQAALRNAEGFEAGEQIVFPGAIRSATRKKGEPVIGPTAANDPLAGAPPRVDAKGQLKMKLEPYADATGQYLLMPDESRAGEQTELALGDGLPTAPQADPNQLPLNFDAPQPAALTEKNIQRVLATTTDINRVDERKEKRLGALVVNAVTGKLAVVPVEFHDKKPQAVFRRPLYDNPTAVVRAVADYIAKMPQDKQERLGLTRTSRMLVERRLLTEGAVRPDGTVIEEKLAKLYPRESTQRKVRFMADLAREFGLGQTLDMTPLTELAQRSGLDFSRLVVTDQPLTPGLHELQGERFGFEARTEGAATAPAAAPKPPKKAGKKEAALEALLQAAAEATRFPLESARERLLMAAQAEALTDPAARAELAATMARTDLSEAEAAALQQRIDDLTGNNPTDTTEFKTNLVRTAMLVAEGSPKQRASKAPAKVAPVVAPATTGQQRLTSDQAAIQLELLGEQNPTKAELEAFARKLRADELISDFDHANFQTTAARASSKKKALSDLQKQLARAIEKHRKEAAQNAQHRLLLDEMAARPFTKQTARFVENMVAAVREKKGKKAVTAGEFFRQAQFPADIYNDEELSSKMFALLRERLKEFQQQEAIDRRGATLAASLGGRFALKSKVQRRAQPLPVTGAQRSLEKSTDYLAPKDHTLLDRIVYAMMARGIRVSLREATRELKAGGFYSPSERVVALVLDSIDQPSRQSILNALHEIIHDITQEAPEAVRREFHDLIERLPDGALAFANNPEADPRLARGEGLTPEQLVIERGVEHLALSGIDRNEARGILEAFIRAVKDLYYRAALYLSQKMWGDENTTGQYARAWMENEVAKVLAGDKQVWDSFFSVLGFKPTFAEAFRLMHDERNQPFAVKVDVSSGRIQYVPVMETEAGPMNVQAAMEQVKQNAKLSGRWALDANLDLLEKVLGPEAVQREPQSLSQVPLVRDEQGRLLAPNGKPSKLSERQWRLVRTPEFKKWFGDWQTDPANASKVVDENGEPLVVYHGTKNVFNSYDREASPEETRDYESFTDLMSGFGDHFAADAEVASRFAVGVYGTSRNQGTPNVQPVFLNIRSLAEVGVETKFRMKVESVPVNTSTVDEILVDEAAPEEALVAMPGDEINTANERVTKYERDADFRRTINKEAVRREANSEETDTQTQNALVNQWKSENAGVDGILYQNEALKEVRGVKDRRAFIAFSPTQIKSAYNVGTFFPDDPDTMRREPGKSPDSARDPEGAGEISKMAAGKQTKSANITRIVKMMGDKLYSSDVSKTTGKELIQNAIDAVMLRPGNRVIAHGYMDSKFYIADNGPGMDPSLIINKYLPAGESGKKIGSGGGLGLAKIAILGGNKAWTVSTIAADPRNPGSFIRTLLTGTGPSYFDYIEKPPRVNLQPDTDIRLAEGMTLRYTYLPAEVNGVPVSTGTAIAVECDDSWAAANFVSEAMKFQPEIESREIKRNYQLPYRFELSDIDTSLAATPEEGLGVLIGDARELESKPKEMALLKTIELPSATVDIIAPVGAPIKKRSYFSYSVLNRSILQFEGSLHFKDDVALPEGIAVNIKPKVAADHAEYPFTTNREGLIAGADQAVKEYFQKVGAERVKELHAIYRNAVINAPKIEGTNGAVFLDAAQEAPKELIDEVTRNPVVAEITNEVGNIQRLILSTLEKRYSGERFGRAKFMGLLTGGGAYGVHFGSPDAKETGIYHDIFLTWRDARQEAEQYIDSNYPNVDQTSLSKLAYTFFRNKIAGIALHEALHQVTTSEGEDLARQLTFKLGEIISPMLAISIPNRSIESYDNINSVLGDFGNRFAAVSASVQKGNDLIVSQGGYGGYALRDAGSSQAGIGRDQEPDRANNGEAAAALKAAPGVLRREQPPAAAPRPRDFANWEASLAVQAPLARAKVATAVANTLHPVVERMFAKYKAAEPSLTPAQRAALRRAGTPAPAPVRSVEDFYLLLRMRDPRVEAAETYATLVDTVKREFERDEVPDFFNREALTIDQIKDLATRQEANETLANKLIGLRNRSVTRIEAMNVEETALALEEETRRQKITAIMGALGDMTITRRLMTEAINDGFAQIRNDMETLDEQSQALGQATGILQALVGETKRAEVARRFDQKLFDSIPFDTLPLNALFKRLDDVVRARGLSLTRSDPRAIRAAVMDSVRADADSPLAALVSLGDGVRASDRGSALLSAIINFATNEKFVAEVMKVQMMRGQERLNAIEELRRTFKETREEVLDDLMQNVRDRTKATADFGKTAATPQLTERAAQEMLNERDAALRDQARLAKLRRDLAVLQGMKGTFVQLANAAEQRLEIGSSFVMREEGHYLDAGNGKLSDEEMILAGKSQTLTLGGPKGMTAEEMRALIQRNEAWLDARKDDPKRQTRVYFSLIRQNFEMKRLMHGAKVRDFQGGLFNGMGMGISEAFLRTGTRAGERLAKAFVQFVGWLRSSAATGEVNGKRFEAARSAFEKAADLSPRDFVELFYDPAFSFFQQYRASENLPEAMAELGRMFAREPVTAKHWNRPGAAKAFFALVEEMKRNNEMRSRWMETAGANRVESDKLLDYDVFTGKLIAQERRQIEQGLPGLTTPRQFRSTLRGWAAQFALRIGADGPGNPFTDLNLKLQQGATTEAALRADLNALFDDSAWHYFLGPLLRNKAGGVPGPRIDPEETRRHAVTPRVMEKVLQKSGRDLLAIADNILEEVSPGLPEDSVEWTQYRKEFLQWVHSRWKFVRGGTESKSSSIGVLVPSIGINARQARNLPDEWLSFPQFTPEDNRRAAHAIFAVGSFGRDAQVVEAGLRDLEKELEARAAELGGLKGRQLDDPAWQALKKSDPEKYKRLRRIAEYLHNTPPFRDIVPQLFHTERELFTSWHLGQEIFAGATVGMVSGLKSAIKNLVSTSNLFLIQRSGSPEVYKTVVGSYAKTGKLFFNSVLQVFGVDLLKNNPLLQSMKRGGAFDAANFVTLNQNLKGERGVEDTLSGFSRVLRLLRTVYSQTKASPFEGGTAPALRLLNPFQFTQQLVNMANTWQLMETYYEMADRAAEVYRRNPGETRELTAADAGMSDQTAFQARKALLAENGLTLEEMARAIAQGKNPLQNDSTVMAMNNISSTLLANEASMINRPLKLTRTKTGRLAGTFVGWSLDQTNRVLRLLETPEGRMTLESLLRGIGVMAITTLPATLAYAALLDDWDELVEKKQNRRRVTDGPEAWTEAAVSVGTFGLWAEAADYFGSMRQGSSPYSDALSLDNRIVLVSSVRKLAQSVRNLNAVGVENVNYSNVVYPLLSGLGASGLLQNAYVLDRLMGGALQDAPGFLGQTLQAEASQAARSNVYNYIREAGRKIGLEPRATATTGAYAITPLTPHITNMVLAALRDDPEAFRAVYERALKVAAKDNFNPQKKVQQTFADRHPFRMLFVGTPTVQEIALMRDSMSDKGRATMDAALDSYLRYGAQIGARPFVGSRRYSEPQLRRAMERSAPAASGLDELFRRASEARDLFDDF